jgi:sugar phosphate isomerase/epimerase
VSTTNLLAISIAPAIAIVRKRYYDLPGTIAFMQQLLQEGVVDGFEFQNLAEWDATNPPRDEAERRVDAWQDSARYTVDEICTRLQETGLPIFSIHANRDVGICLCSQGEQDVQRGRQLIEESLSLAERVSAQVCVFHLWDTWKESFDPDFLKGIVAEISPHFPSVRMAVENVPTHLPGFTPFELAKEFSWVTLDLKWVSLYDELEEFEAIKERIVNVHLRGQLQGNKWVLPNAPFQFYEVLNKIRNKWRYSGLITMEPDGLHQASLDDFELAMATLRVME